MQTKINVEEFNGIEDDMQFAQMLLNEELVFVLPGRGFNAPNYFRIVYAATQDKLAEACDRLTTFCAKHHK
jgi:aspartate/methionine/tyrosine aminotransferase